MQGHCSFMRDLQLAGIYFKNLRYARKDRVRDGEHEHKMQVSFAIKGLCEMGFMDCLSDKYRRLEFTADTLGRVSAVNSGRLRFGALRSRNFPSKLKKQNYHVQLTLFCVSLLNS